MTSPVEWLIFVVVVVAIMGSFGRAITKPRPAYDADAIHIHSPTQYICASLHTGRIDPQTIVDRLQDRHKARLPELGLNTARILSEARKANRREAFFSTTALLATLWFLDIALGLVPAIEDATVVGVESAFEATASQFLSLIYPLLSLTLLGIAEVIAINIYLRRNILALNDPPDEDPQQNVVIYGGFSPFAGYGLDLDGMSFSLDAAKPNEGDSRKPQAFEQVELLNYLSRELETNVALGDSFDKLFVNGQRIRGQKVFLYNNKAMPNTAVSPTVMASMIGKASTEVRHYRLFSVPFAHNHLYVTYFLRSTMVGENLFIESRCFLLTPLRAAFTELNELPTKRGIRYHAGVMLLRLAMSPFALFRGPTFVWSQTSKLCSTLAKKIFGDPEDKLKARSETYNYGQFNSLREAWSSGLFHTYFQKLDNDMITKTCQHVILNSIVDFLASKGVNTEDLKESRTQIINSGVIVHGGVVNAHQLAVGTGASAKAAISNVLPSRKSKE